MNNNTQNNQQEKQLSIGKKVKYSFYSALIFFFISSPIMYQLTQKLNGHFVNTSDPSGCPSNTGLLLHTGIFFLIIFIVMCID